MLVRINHRELTTESKSTKLSIMRFWKSISLAALDLGGHPTNPYLVALLEQHLIIFAQCHAENNRCHILEAVDPFFAFAALTPNIKHAVKSLVTCQTRQRS